MTTQNIVIEGRPPGDASYGVVDALRQENADYADDRGKLLAAAQSKLHHWGRAANDQEGAFRGWSFRVTG